jgi:hypothetical protein
MSQIEYLNRSLNFRSLLTSKNGTNNRQKNISQSDDRIFEHPEVTIKPGTIDDRVSRRLIISTKSFTPNENGGGSVPNILEHPDIRTPIVMETQQLSSSSSSSSSSDKGKLFRQQSGKKKKKARLSIENFLFSGCLFNISTNNITNAFRYSRKQNFVFFKEFFF